MPKVQLAGAFKLRSICYVSVLGFAVILMPPRAKAGDNSAIFGAIAGVAGVAAAAIIASSAANAQRNQQPPVVRSRNRAVTPEDKQTAQAGSDPFAGITPVKVRRVRDE